MAGAALPLPPTRRDAVLGLAATPATGAPKRIVSLSPCLDAILVEVADRGQIAALSHYSHSLATSSIGARGLRLPFTYESAEEIVALKPDFVLMAGLEGPATRAALAKLGVRSELFGAPSTIAQSRTQVARIAALAGHPERGADLVRQIDAAVAAARPRRDARPISALVFEAGGMVSGPGTLVDEMLRTAGFANAAAQYGLTHTGSVPLEQLLADPPQALLIGAPEPGEPTWADRVLSHPALAAIGGRTHRASFPARLTYCGGPTIIAALTALANVRRDLEGLGA